MHDSVVAAAVRLRGAVDALTKAEVEQAVAIAELAEACEWTADATFDVIGTRPVRIGADGTALVDEFLPLEVATAKGISVAAATWLIRDVVNLKARHPLLWLQACRGLIPMFRACQLAAEVARFDLTVDQAQALDERLAPKVPTLPWRRVLQLARGLVTELAAEKVTALQQEAHAARFVRKLPTDDPAVAYLSARVDTPDAIFFDAMVDRIADILGERGDTDLKDIRRAKAIGVLATPARAQLMLEEALRPSSRSGSKRAIKSTDPRLLPQAQVFVHVAEETLLRGAGPARVEGVGALPATMLKYLLGHSRVRLTPVIRPYAEVTTDSYEIPEPIRRQVLLRDQFEVFPFSSRTPRRPIWITPCPTVAARRARPGRRTSAGCPADPTGPRPTPAGSSNNPGPASSGGPHLPASTTGSAPTARCASVVTRPTRLSNKRCWTRTTRPARRFRVSGSPRRTAAGPPSSCPLCRRCR